MDDEQTKGAIGEEILDQVKAIRELVAAQPTRVEFNELKADVSELKTDIKVIKAAVTDQSKQLQNHEQRIGDLEQVTT